MDTVFILTCESCLHGEYQNEILCVCENIAEAQFAITDNINLDLQYSGLGDVLDVPDDFDFYEGAKAGTPCPTKHARLYKGEDPWESEDFIDYEIVEYNVIKHKN